MSERIYSLDFPHASNLLSRWMRPPAPVSRMVRIALSALHPGERRCDPRLHRTHATCRPARHQDRAWWPGRVLAVDRNTQPEGLRADPPRRPDAWGASGCLLRDARALAGGVSPHLRQPAVLQPGAPARWVHGRQPAGCVRAGAEVTDPRYGAARSEAQRGAGAGDPQPIRHGHDNAEGAGVGVRRFAHSGRVHRPARSVGVARGLRGGR
jgi:hypothetical protein